MVIRKALLVGINYIGTSNKLFGCINDVNNMKSYLLDNGYIEDDIQILTDETPVKPTKKNLLNALFQLVISYSDKLFFHYSGHGTRIFDANGDEADKNDEAIVPLDFAQEGIIIDDQLRGILCCMSPKSTMTIVLDSCHSGTCMDLAYTIAMQKKTIKKIVKGKPINTIVEQWDFIKDNRNVETPGNVILLSGCMDAQYSADTFEDGQSQGAMTCCLLRTLPKAKNLLELLLLLRRELERSGYKQTAFLSSGKALPLHSAVHFC